MDPSETARAVVKRAVADEHWAHCMGDHSAKLPECAYRAIAAALQAERERCATFVETVEWRELPRDAYPVSRSRFKLALTQLMGDVAAALRRGEG